MARAERFEDLRVWQDARALVRAVRSAMVSEHHERLRELRRQIDDLLGE